MHGIFILVSVNIIFGFFPTVFFVVLRLVLVGLGRLNLIVRHVGVYCLSRCEFGSLFVESERKYIKKVLNEILIRITYRRFFFSEIVAQLSSTDTTHVICEIEKT